MVAFLTALVQAGIDVAPYVSKLVTAFQSGSAPTQAQLDELTTMENDLDAQLQAASPDAA